MPEAGDGSEVESGGEGRKSECLGIPGGAVPGLRWDTPVVWQRAAGAGWPLLMRGECKVTVHPAPTPLFWDKYQT